MTGGPALLVFDVDGTLVDSQAHIVASLAAAFAAVDLPMPAREVALAVVGLSLPLALRRLAPDIGEAGLDAMIESYKAEFQRLRVGGQGASPLYPGTRAMLESLARRPATLLGIATGKSRRGLNHLMESHGLAPLFATMQVADDHPSKPDPSMLFAALRETGAAARHAVMIGDTSFDIEMGRAAGFATIAVTWGYHGPHMLAGADAAISDWAGLPDALGRLGVPA